MAEQQLSLAARPRTLDGLIGQEKLVAQIRGHWGSGRVVKGWLLCGPRGTGKTTTARILALSYQCTHQRVFGAPCKECRAVQSGFDIVEINASDITGIDKMREVLQGTDFAPRAGNYRVYILDEMHGLSVAAQNLALKYLEDSPATTIFILCSTVPQKVIETLRSRCITYKFRDLNVDDIPKLVQKLLAKIKSDLPADRLADALIERGVGSPRLIAHAVEKYAAGANTEDAADVEAATPVDTKALTRAVVKGNWQDAAKYLAEAQKSDIPAIRLSTTAYLRSMLLQSAEVSDRTACIAKGIKELVDLQRAEESIMAAGLAAALYHVTAMFSRYAM